MWLLLAFIAVPLIEIALFIQVGGAIGLWPTLAIVVLTALLGTYLVRQQGMAQIAQLRGSLNDLRDPTEPLAHGAMILFSAALLLTPGFFTDALGFALLVHPVRVALMAYARRRMSVQSFTMGGTSQQSRPSPRSSVIIEGEFEETRPTENNATPPTNGSSGWTRH